jgi:DNA-binding NtrC family response regulator
VQAGRFRRDLFFRLGAATVVLPPLRERPREIAVLAGAFLDDARTRAGLPPLVLAPATMQHLLHHAWPGNVRELKNVMEYLAATLDGEVVLPEHLPASLRRGEATPAPPPDAPPPANEPEAPPEAGAAFRPIAEEIRDLERARMAAALEAAGGVRSRAAALISMPLRTLVHKIKQYGLEAVGREPK